jgi:hypothetical protein
LKHPSLVAALDDLRQTLAQGQDPAHLLRGVLSPATYERLADAARGATQAAGLTEPQGVMLRAYTERDLDAWPLMNTLAREMPHLAPLTLHADDLYRAVIMLQVMDAALAALPARPGTYRRGMQSLDMPGALRARWLSAHRAGVAVQYEGYTSIMDGEPYGGDLLLMLHAANARDIGAWSADREPELLVPRHSTWRVNEVSTTSGDRSQRYVVMTETDATIVPVRRQFAAGEPSPEMAECIAAIERRRAGPPPTQAEADRYERMQVEAGGPIPARFKHLQYLNKQP